MSRLISAAVLLALLPTLSVAEAKKYPRPVVKPAGLSVPASSANCPGCGPSTASLFPRQGPLATYQDAGSTFGSRLTNQLFWDQHECAPDGCPTPIGCGNFWTEKKFIFGSCRQFFGTASSTAGHHRGTVER